MVRKVFLGFVILILFSSSPAFCHLFSSTFAELHFDFGKTDENFDKMNSDGIVTLTLEHYSVFAYGDNFFFIDVCTGRDFGTGTEENSIYVEYAPRLSINRIAGWGKWESFISEAYFTPQINYGHGAARFHFAGEDEGERLDRFQIGPTFLFGLSLDLNVPGIQVLSVHFLYRHDIREGNDPVDFTPMPQADQGFQFTLVWGMNLGDVGESLGLKEIKKDDKGEVIPNKAGEIWFRGFLDYWDRGAIHNDRGTLLTEPQFLIYLSNTVAIGSEIELSYNFAGSYRGTRHFECDPTLFFRMDFQEN